MHSLLLVLLSDVVLGYFVLLEIRATHRFPSAGCRLLGKLPLLSGFPPRRSRGKKRRLEASFSKKGSKGQGEEYYKYGKVDFSVDTGYGT